MKVAREQLSTSSEVLNYFSQYTTGETNRLGNLKRALQEALPLVEDLRSCNQALTEAGRPDLQITDRAAMLPISTAEEVIANSPGNNFTPNFAVYTGSKETGELNPATLEPEIEPILATDEQLEDVIKIPLFRTAGEISELRESGTLPIFNQFNHLSKPSLLRMFALRSNFTKSVIQRVSDPKSHYNYYRAMPEVFVAYQLMSRLVDITDLYVTKEGAVDDHYLCR